ncbi:MAG: hypothetical protein IMY72_10810 [Bacteroidetes bacterium]|nr:hypothetical protein [Bacteroidota bacterium]
MSCRRDGFQTRLYIARQTRNTTRQNHVPSSDKIIVVTANPDAMNITAQPKTNNTDANATPSKRNKKTFLISKKRKHQTITAFMPLSRIFRIKKKRENKLKLNGDFFKTTYLYN